ncbi:hypothetical protein BXZ70DRAFT_977205 [Cristinia sonorae]|uniref:C2H2-type domain-containing protein n=1 Tax=Cristinia sonorae TaxID=1940300 RepID=A0A8K0XLZ9_9AGAR|nr:hypothetical protein BXZ70DRAFT_977205 [Cristinia sonorae]
MAYCDRCERYFVNDRALWQHEENSNNHWMCYKCERDFTSHSALTQHFANSSLHHYCRTCSRDFDDYDSLLAHFQKAHHYCTSCYQFFSSKESLVQHKSAKHWYCTPCDRIFLSESNLDNHLRSSTHQPKRFKCPGCTNSYISSAALILHCESGTCRSGVTRQAVDRLVISLDRNNVITNPNRLIKGPDGSYRSPASVTQWATLSSWNGRAYECVLCHKEFSTLNALNAHLQSPAHADKIYRCPNGWNGCGTQFRTLSGLVQHVEGATCGVKRFRSQVDNLLESVTDGMRRIAL